MSKESNDINFMSAALKAIFEMMEERQNNTPDFEDGDRVTLKDKVVASYLVPVTSNKTISKDFKTDNENLLNFFVNTPGIVTKLEEPFHYKCGHCDLDHSHDIKIYYENIDHSFYASSHAIRLFEEI